jgi:hypothetical protein
VKKVKVLRSERFGIFTVVEVQDEKSGKKAVGISRRSKLDRINDELGISIATGRANKALSLKLKGKFINNANMG